MFSLIKLLFITVVFTSLSAHALTVKDDDRVHVNNFRQRRSADSLFRVKRESLHSISDDVRCSNTQAVINDRLSRMATDQKKLFVDEVELGGDNKFSLQMAWTGEDMEKIIVITSEDGVSTCYLSDETGRKFNNISTKLGNSTINSDLSLQKHPTDSKTVYIVSTTLLASSSNLYASTDGGSTFQPIPLTFVMGTLMFHPTKPDLVMSLDEHTQELYMSIDKGLSWSKVKSRVLSAKWSTEKDSENIFAVTNQGTDYYFIFSESHNNMLERSTDLGKTWTKLYEHVYTFGVGGKFLYASAFITDSTNDERKLIVSTDAGTNWNHVRLPVITPDRFYSILDSTQGQIFLHVDDPGNTGRGTLYTSDATGIVFSESLKDHLYPNYEDLTDFYVVQSMHGVYIASQLSADNSIHTLISYDRGGEWQSIKRPDGIPCIDETKPCYLQIHNLYSIKRGIPASPPLSVANAIGIIMVHGHVADSLQTTDPDVYVSSDGGYTWRLALKGPHHYQIADHGGLLVAVPADTENPSVVKFSTDEGHCWVTYNFTEGREKIQFTGLLVEPGNRAMTVAIWGYTSDRVWHTYVLNFTQLIDKPCGESDYEEWMAHVHNGDQGCLLGAKETFRRLKADSWCYNGKAYMVQKSSAPCDCTPDDYDCDYGYVRQNETCVKDPSVKDQELDICRRNHEEKLVPLGYHKIPGDICTGGFRPPEAKLVDLSTQCNDDTIGDEVDHGSNKEQQVEKEKLHQAEKKSTATKVIVTLLIVGVIIALMVVVTIYARKYRRRTITYRYMSIRADEERAVNGKPQSTSLYEDSSDDEGPTSTETKGVSTSSASNGHIPNGKAPSTGKVAGTSSGNYLDSDEEMLH